MATVQITFERNDHLADFDLIFAEIATPEVASLCEVGVNFAQTNAPIDLGVYRNGFSNEITNPEPGIIQGRIFNTANPVLVEVIENGRKPGRFPPVDVIRAWCSRKLAVPAKILNSVAYLVGRKIATYGIPGKFIFKQTAEVIQPLAERAAVRISEKMAARI